jgi:DNA-directed RNA polymerase specialized sigma24 family protein
VQAKDNVVELRRDREAPVNPSSFDDLFLDHQDRLYRALYFVTGSREDAEELMQDAFLKLWERWDTIRKIDDPVAWLFRVSLNGFRMRKRRAAVAVRRLVPPCSGIRTTTSSSTRTSAGCCWGSHPGSELRSF